MEAIPNGTFGKDVARVVRIWFKFRSKLSDDKSYMFGLVPCVPVPGGLREIPVGDHRVGVSDQELQYENLFGGETAHAAAGTSDLVGSQVDCTILEHDFGLFLVKTRDAPQEGPHPSQQLPNYERRGNVVVGPGVPDVDAALCVVVPGQDNDSDTRVQPYPPAQRVRLDSFKSRGQNQRMVRSTT
jgi:hypothetical protein